MKYSVSLWPFIQLIFNATSPDVGMEKFLEQLSNFKYDGVELPELDPKVFPLNMKSIKELLKSYNLEVSAIDFAKDLTNPDERMRKEAVKLGKNCVDFAKNVGAPLIVLPPAYKKTRPSAQFEMEWGWAVSSLKEIGEYAGSAGIFIAIEPVERYHTYLVNNTDQALKLMEDVGLENVKIMLDCFHMNIEEPDPIASIRKVGKDLIHVHVADSNRGAAGGGHIDFKPIMRSLKEIGYSRYLSLEAWPMAEKIGVNFSSYNLSKEITEKSMKQLIQNSIEYLRFVEKFV